MRQTFFLQLRHFLLDVFQEVGTCMADKIKTSHMASTVVLTNSSATQNHVVFQLTSDQAK